MKLLELRKKQNKKQEEIAKEINITRATYSNYEAEKTQPEIETLKKIADYYMVSLDYLCEHETKHLLDLSNLSEEKKQLINMIVFFNEIQVAKMTGYALRLTQEF